MAGHGDSTHGNCMYMYRRRAATSPEAVSSWILQIANHAHCSTTVFLVELPHCSTGPFTHMLVDSLWHNLMPTLRFHDFVVVNTAGT